CFDGIPQRACPPPAMTHRTTPAVAREMTSMSKAILLTSLASLLLPAAALAAVPGAKPTAFVRQVAPLSTVERVTMPPLDKDPLRAEAAERPRLDLPPRFAFPFPVDLTPDNAGTWEALGGGQLLWRLRLRSAGALSLNLGFTRYSMPEGG